MPAEVKEVSVSPGVRSFCCCAHHVLLHVDFPPTLFFFSRLTASERAYVKQLTAPCMSDRPVISSALSGKQPFIHWRSGAPYICAWVCSAVMGMTDRSTYVVLYYAEVGLIWEGT